MEKKSLSSLADEYYESIELLQQLIDSNRKKLNLAIKRGRRTEEFRLKGYLRMLYSQKLELVRTAATLKNYYQFSTVNKPEYI